MRGKGILIVLLCLLIGIVLAFNVLAETTNIPPVSGCDNHGPCIANLPFDYHGNNLTCTHVDSKTCEDIPQINEHRLCVASYVGGKSGNHHEGVRYSIVKNMSHVAAWPMILTAYGGESSDDGDIFSDAFDDIIDFAEDWDPLSYFAYEQTGIIAEATGTESLYYNPFGRMHLHGASAWSTSAGFVADIRDQRECYPNSADYIELYDGDRESIFDFAELLHNHLATTGQLTEGASYNNIVTFQGKMDYNGDIKNSDSYLDSCIYTCCDWDGDNLSYMQCDDLLTDYAEDEDDYGVCGDGSKTALEQCDDGNRLSFDGCSATCRRETKDISCQNGLIGIKYSTKIGPRNDSVGYLYPRDHDRTIAALATVNKRQNISFGLSSLTKEQIFTQMSTKFEPDENKSLCLASACGFSSAWLANNTAIANANQNYCCGDDANDVGSLQTFGGKVKACVQWPNGNFAWVAPDESYNTGSTVGFIKGDTFTVYDENYYTQELDENDRLIDKTPTSTFYELLSTGTTWKACIASGGSLRGSAATQGMKINPGTTFDVEGAGGQIHQYACVNSKEGPRFVECYGNSLPFNQNFAASGKWKAEGTALGQKYRELISADTIVKYADINFIPVDGASSILSLSKSAPPTGAPAIDGGKAIKIEVNIPQTTSGSTPSNAIVEMENSRDFLLDDWSNKNIEGFIYFQDAIPIELIAMDGSTEHVYPLSNFVIGNIEPRKWLYFYIPNLNFGVSKLKFRFNTGLYNFKTSGRYTFYLDGIRLIDSSFNKVCGMRNENHYSIYSFYDSRSSNKDACNANFKYTGSACCGDTKNNYRIGTEGSCWNSTIITPGKRFAPISYQLKINEGSPDQTIINQQFTCIDSSNGQAASGSTTTTTDYCTYMLPALPTNTRTVKIINQNSALYNVTFESNGNTVSENPKDKIKVHVNIYDLVALADKISYCGRTPGKYNSIKNAFNLPIEDSTQQAINSGTCSMADQFRCSLDNGWATALRAENRDGNATSDVQAMDGRGAPPLLTEFTKVKSVPSQFTNQVDIDTSCCPQDYCWNGQLCVEDESDEPFREPSFFTGTGKGFRCLNGNWKEGTQKYNPAGITIGYCGNQSQCFLSTSGVVGTNGVRTNQCVASGTGSGDYSCSNGAWVSRTWKLATTLIDKSAASSYSLYCDDFNQAVNYANQAIGGKSIKEYALAGNTCRITTADGRTIPCFNNMCVLKTNRGILFATSLNEPINGSKNLATVFGVSNIDVCKSGNVLKRCSSQQYVNGKTLSWYYDPKEKFLIASEISLTGTSSLFSTLISKIRNWLFGNQNREIDISLRQIVDNLNVPLNAQDERADRIYISSEGGRSIIALKGKMNSLLTGKDYEYAAVRYSNFNFQATQNKNICNYVDAYGNKHALDNVDMQVKCFRDNSAGSPYFIFAYGENSVTIWKDMTAKLRVG